MRFLLGAHFGIDEANEIKNIAERADLTVAQLIRRAVREYIDRYRPLESTIEPLEVQEQVAA